MFGRSAPRLCPTQSVVSIPEVNKHSESQVAKSGVVLYQNPAVTNYAEDFQTRLEVVSKLVPQHEVQRVYGEFVKKLNEMCYETVADQLVRSSRPASVASSVCSQNIRPLNGRNGLKTDNAANSTMRRLYQVAEGMKKHLSTISESNHSNGLLIPEKSKNQRNKSKNVTRGNDLDMDNTMNHFRSTTIVNSKSSRKVAPEHRRKKHVETSSVEMVETEFNITKDSLRNSSIVVREQRQRITTIRRNSKSRRKPDDSQRNPARFNKNAPSVASEESSHRIRVKPKKTALSPFFERLYKQRRSDPKTLSLLQS